MKKITKNLFKCLAVLCTILMVGQIAMTVEAAKTNEYLIREVGWDEEECTARTTPDGVGLSCYAVATVFLYDKNGVCIISNSHSQKYLKFPAVASAEDSDVRSARAYHYVTSGSEGKGTAYGYVYEEVGVGTNI